MPRVSGAEMHSLLICLITVAEIALIAGAFTAGRYAGRPTDGILMRIRARHAERRLLRERERESHKFKLVGRLSTTYQSWLLGIDMGASKAFAYFYENSLGERKVDVTEPEMNDLPEVVYFLAGKPIADIEKIGKVT